MPRLRTPRSTAKRKDDIIASRLVAKLLVVTLAVTVTIALVRAGWAGATNVRTVICKVFGPYCEQALRVSYCETGGTYSVWASNGQYLGLFQMGAHERATYGNGNDAWAQARAAYRYFVATGRTWSPWTCKPW